MTASVERLKRAVADRYLIGRELGQGGMATVYLAQDVRHDRSVALKVLRADLTEALGAERFVREIRLVARLAHPNIVPLYDSGEAGGFLFFVMPVIEGESLRARIAGMGRLPIDEVRQLGREVAEALDYAHRHDVVHRDIKPENILLHAGHAMVADFGIGKVVSAAADPTSITQTGIAIGTPMYMSPEQATGESAIDGRTDLYSLGCVLFEALSGELPFSGPTIQAVLAKRLTATPPTITHFRAGVPASLARAIARLLAPLPQDRFATGAEAVTALAATDSPEPEAPIKPSIAVLPFANLSPDPDNEYFSDGITEEILSALSRLEGVTVASRTSSFSFKGVQHDLRTVSQRLNVTHVLEGSVRRAGSRVRIAAQLVDVRRDQSLWSERYDREIDDIFAVQDEIATTIARRLRATLRGSTPTKLVTAGTEKIEAYEAYLKGRHFWNQRSADLGKALGHFERAVEIDPTFGQPYAGIAESYAIFALYGMVPQAEARRLASDAAERALATAEDDADVRYAAATVEYYLGWDLERAEARYRAALDISPRHARTHAYMAQMFGFLGRVDEARESARLAHDADPMSPLINAVAASGLAFAGRYEEAAEYADRALEIDPRHAVANFQRALCCLALKRDADAVAAAEIAVATHRSAFSLGILAASLGARDVDGSRQVLERVNALTAADHPRWMACFPLVVLGDIDAAVGAACDSLRGNHWAGWAAGCVDLLAPITRDPRWQGAMRDRGLGSVVEGRLRHLSR